MLYTDKQKKTTKNKELLKQFLIILKTILM